MRRPATLALAAALFAAASPSAFAAEAACDGRIEVVGGGETRAVPDIARITIRVEAAKTTSSQAMRAAAAAARRVMDALAADGVAATDMTTVEISLRPVYDRPEEGDTAKITGYAAASALRVTLRDLAAFGGAVDSAVSAGATSVSSPQLVVGARKALLVEARAAAVRDAREKAAGMAAAAGLTLGPVVEMSDGGARPHRPSPLRAMAMETSDMPIAAGEQEISAEVRMVFRLCR